MGHSLSWIAVKGISPEETHSVLNVYPTGTWEEFLESKIAGAQLPGGWYLVVFSRKEIGEKLLKKLSSRGELVYCFVEEHVMVSSSAYWSHEKMTWSVIHDAQKGLRDLQVAG